MDGVHQVSKHLGSGSFRKYLRVQTLDVLLMSHPYMFSKSVFP